MKRNLIKRNDGGDLVFDVFKYDVILFSMGINNSMSKGFSYNIGLNFPKVKESENETGYGDLRKLGTIHETETDGIKFVACYIHNGGYHKEKDGSFLNLDVLRKCLEKVKEKYSGKKIGSILLGGNKNDGNCDKDKLLKVLEEVLSGEDITVYTKESIDYQQVIYKEILEVRNKYRNKEITRDEYYDIRSDIEWRRKNGIYKKKPDDFKYITKKGKTKLLFIGNNKKY